MNSRVVLSTRTLLIKYLRRYVVGNGPEVDFHDGVHAGDDEEEAGTDCLAAVDTAEAEYDGTFIFLKFGRISKFNDQTCYVASQPLCHAIITNQTPDRPTTINRLSNNRAASILINYSHYF